MDPAPKPISPKEANNYEGPTDYIPQMRPRGIE